MAEPTLPIKKLRWVSLRTNRSRAWEERSRDRLQPFWSTGISLCHLILDLPTPATALWENFREALSAGFTLDNNEDEANWLTPQAISRYLQWPRLAEPAKVNREVNMELDAFLYRHDRLYNRAGNHMR